MRYRSWALTRHRGGDVCSDLLRRLGKVGVTRRRLHLRVTQQLPNRREALAGCKLSFQDAFRGLPVFPSIGIGRHGAVGREPGDRAHLFQEGVLDRLLAGRQDEFEVGAVVDVRQYGPGGAVDGLDGGQADRESEAEKVEVGIPVAAAAVGARRGES